MYSTQVNAINNGYISFCQDENGGLGATLFQINNSVPGAGSLSHGIDSGYNPFIFILIVPKIGAKVFLTWVPVWVLIIEEAKVIWKLGLLSWEDVYKKMEGARLMEQPICWFLGPPRSLSLSSSHCGTDRMGVKESCWYSQSLLSLIFYNAILFLLLLLL